MRDSSGLASKSWRLGRKACRNGRRAFIHVGRVILWCSRRVALSHSLYMYVRSRLAYSSHSKKRLTRRLLKLNEASCSSFYLKRPKMRLRRLNSGIQSGTNRHLLVRKQLRQKLNRPQNLSHRKKSLSLLL